MINKIKKNSGLFMEIVIIFLISLVFNIFINNLTVDEVWNYGFSLNIANGMIPYKDFNIVITPLFPFLGAFFLILFGNSFLVYHIFNAFICVLIFLYMKKNNPKSYLISYGILLFFALPNYSLFCILLLYILMDMEEQKYNNYYIGIVLGLVFLTKQNIGIYFWIPTLFLKSFKIFFKRFIGFIIPCLLLLIYLIYNDCLYEFVDYTFLGITDFASKNSVIYFSCLVFTIMIIVYLSYKYIKTRDFKIIYLICIQGLAFPLVDAYHVMLPFICGLNFFLSHLNLNKKIISIAIIFMFILTLSYNCYKCSTDIYSFPNDTDVYKFRKLKNTDVYVINYVGDFIKNNEGNTYLIDMFSYLIKINVSIKIDRFDLLNDGNLGKNGEMKIILELEKICSNEKCTFLLNDEEVGNPERSQYNQDIYRYIVNNYRKTDKLLVLSVYTNY